MRPSRYFYGLALVSGIIAWIEHSGAMLALGIIILFIGLLLEMIDE